MFRPGVSWHKMLSVVGEFFSRRRMLGAAVGGLGVAALISSCSVEPPPPAWGEFEPGVAYTNFVVKEAPWSIHVVRVDRHQTNLEFHTTHARGKSLGLAAVSEQVGAFNPAVGKPLAAINGDYFQTRARSYVGDPRGLQIAEGELLSSPQGGASFWTDPAGHPHLTNVESQCRITWTNGETMPFGVNEARRPAVAVLYTPALGLRTTGTTNGLEFVLERQGSSPWHPLHIGDTITARVREINTNANSELSDDTMVLSFSKNLMTYVPPVETGAVVTITLETSPSLKGLQTAIGGGPGLFCGGKKQKWGRKPADDEEPLPYEFRTMDERHPRTALGWSERYIYFVVVDGRQRGVSDGMTLSELGSYMTRKLGCTDVMNFDGGGSSTLWGNGQVRNSPCDGYEREVANALIVVKKAPPPAASK